MSYTYQWYRVSANRSSLISGATHVDYVVQEADVGETVTCTVTATSPAGSALVTSAGTGIVLPPDLTSLAARGTTVTVRPAANLPLLVDPNRANNVLVVLPLHAQGGVVSTTVLPVAGVPVAGRLWFRVVRFQQPLTGPAVDPHLNGVTGVQPVWGAHGAGSVDQVLLTSTDGQSWTIESAVSSPVASVPSVLDTVSGARAPGTSPLALPNPVLEWCAADMSETPNGSTFSPGARVGLDQSGSGNDLLVNVAESVTYSKGPLAGTGTTPSGLNGFPFVSATSARTGVGVDFAGGPFAAWTILVSLEAADQAGGGRFNEQDVFNVRSVQNGTPFNFAIKYGDTTYTYDGNTFVDTSWLNNPFASNGIAVPCVVGVSCDPAYPAGLLLLAGSLGASCTVTRPATQSRLPSAIGGLDLPNSYAQTGILVYAAALDASQMQAAALRLAYVAHGEVS